MTDKEGWLIFEEAMVMLEDVPGETMLERIGRLKGWYLQMQIMVEKLKDENERLKANESNILNVTDHDINSRRNLG